jgi:curli biogenesis system outer membrane secretion channel CsgG
MKAYVSISTMVGAVVAVLGSLSMVQAQDVAVEAEAAAVEAVASEAKRAVAEEPEVARKARVHVVPAIMTQERRRRIDREMNERFGLSDPNAWENPGYTSHLIDALVNTRKFDVVEREELRVLAQEMAFGESEYVDVNEAVRMGNMIGADYVVIPTISYLEVNTVEKNVPYIGGTQVSLEVKLGTAVRTVDVSTGKIIASNVNKLDKTERVRQGNRTSSSVVEMIASVFKDSALAEAAMIVDVAYPIRIMSVSGDTVMLNRGRGAIVKGENLKIFNVGQMLVDPDTKESLGFAEEYVGMIQVTDVDQKTSKGQIVEKLGQIEPMAVCRRTSMPSTESQEKKFKPAPKID